MVILRHRSDAFERYDPRGGEADLILAKHRNGPTKAMLFFENRVRRRGFSDPFA